MLALHARDNRQLSKWTNLGVGILRVTRNSSYVEARRSEAALLVDGPGAGSATGFGSVLFRALPKSDGEVPPNSLLLSSSLGHLDDGDVVRIAPDGEIRIMFRRHANANSLLLTERCNSRCVMCSQPPKDVDDGFLVDEILRAIPLIAADANEIGITGGEPVLLGERLLAVLRALKCHLPQTAVHVLSNGRLCKDIAVARSIASINHHDLMLGVPLYADVASVHDFVVQADGAFDETIEGIVNLKQCGVPVEVRMVLHRHTVPRLVPWARFVARNLQFIDHVALMGLEMMGFARTNADDLWIDPTEYQPALAEAVHHLRWAGIRTSIYNHQLCVLSPSIRRFAVKSISDWKNDFVEECAHCEARGHCAGFFTSSLARRSAAIAPLRLAELFPN